MRWAADLDPDFKDSLIVSLSRKSCIHGNVVGLPHVSRVLNDY
jgi:hypothetical protein